MDKECRRIRETLQNIHDENLEIPGEVQNHLNTCPGCKEYQALLSSLGTSLSVEIDEKLDTISPPDFAVIYRKTYQRRRILSTPAIWGIAAVMVFSLGIFFSILYSSHQKRAEYISMDVEMFVSDIFSRPILYDDSGQTDAADRPGWFDDDFYGEGTSLESTVDMDIYFLD